MLEVVATTVVGRVNIAPAGTSVVIAENMVVRDGSG